MVRKHRTSLIFQVLKQTNVFEIIKIIPYLKQGQH